VIFNHFVENDAFFANDLPDEFLPETQQRPRVMKLNSTWILKSGAIATLLTAVGWSASQFAQNQSIFGGFCAIVRALLLLPGVFFALALSIAFSPQGGHGMDTYFWIMPPASWLVYFFIGVAIYRRKSERATV
jgi:hypothetical protein